MLRWTGLVVACVIVAAPASARACIWDTETMLQERSRFPTALELMTGKFLRHTPEFYRWRVQDRLSRIAREPRKLYLVDDLAAAYDKLGQHAEAIAAMQAILPRDPRRYETLANLGTFYLHSGDFEHGLEFIDLALEVNPEAHFGRERYQRWLVEYLLAKRGMGGPPTLPKYTDESKGFEGFLAAKSGAKYLELPEAQAAVNGVLGMMRFGKHDSPILYEALGDLLSGPMHTIDAKRLAVRAYLLAAEVTPDVSARAAYEEMAAMLVAVMSPDRLEEFSLEGIRSALKNERAEADAWYAELAARERDWVLYSPDPEFEVRRLYAEDPVLSGLPPGWLADNWRVLAGILAIFVVFAALGLRMARRSGRDESRNVKINWAGRPRR